MDKMDRDLCGALSIFLAISLFVGGLCGYYIGVRSVQVDQPAIEHPVPIDVSMTVIMVNQSLYETAWLMYMGVPYVAEPNQTYFAIWCSFVTEPNSTLIIRYTHQDTGTLMSIDAYALCASFDDVSWVVYPRTGDWSQLTVYPHGNTCGYAAFLGHTTSMYDILWVNGLQALAYKEA